MITRELIPESENNPNKLANRLYAGALMLAGVAVAITGVQAVQNRLDPIVGQEVVCPQEGGTVMTPSSCSAE